MHNMGPTRKKEFTHDLTAVTCRVISVAHIFMYAKSSNIKKAYQSTDSSSPCETIILIAFTISNLLSCLYTTKQYPPTPVSQWAVTGAGRKAIHF